MRPVLKFLQQHVLPAGVCFGGAFILAQLGWLDRIENLTLDARTRLRAAVRPTPVQDQLAVVGIDETSLHKYKRWPWPLAVHADFLQLVGLGGPRVVAWDILFTEPTPDDTKLSDGILAAKGYGARVILGAETADPREGALPGSEEVTASRLAPLDNVEGDRSRILTSPAMLLPAGDLSQVADEGFVDTPPDPDGVRRLAPLVVRVGNEVYPTLSLQSLILYWRAKPGQVTVRLGDAITIDTPTARRRIPIDATGAYLINYRHNLQGFRVHGYAVLHDFLQAFYVDKKPVQAPAIDGRILLVGQVADGLADFGPTPFSALTPLVLVHANVIENVLNEDYAHRVPAAPVWLGGLALGVAGLAVFARRKLHWAAAFSFGLPVAYGIAATLAWVEWSRWLPLVGPVLGFGSLQLFEISRRLIREQRAKEVIRGMFGTYLSPQLVKRMEESGEPPQLGGHEEDITAYFSDIQAYSTFSEKLPPAQLVELLNEYLTVCTDIIQEEGGTLDKYIGDAVVAMFGAPILLPDHAARACVAALRVQHRLGELREKWKAEGDRWPLGVREMQSRIGLNSGPAIIGNMGSRSRFNYTMTGDNVNLAARMESGAKAWGAYTMTTEATRQACEQYAGDRVVFRPLGRITVKGRSAPVRIFEPVGLKEHLTPETWECIRLFTAGLERHDARDWTEAQALFEQSARLEPGQPGKTPGVTTNPSLVYLDIVRRYQAAPPPEDWNGVFEMREK